jgi:acyl carrier protein
LAGGVKTNCFTQENPNTKKWRRLLTTTEIAIRDRVKDFIVTNFFLDVSEIQLEDGTSFLETGIIDSTGIMEVVSFLQEEFGIDIEDREILPENLDSLAFIARFVSQKMVNN